MSLIIDAGHGGKDPGALGNGIVEKDMVLNISLYQFNRFKELGVPVKLTRSSDVTLDSNTRADIVKRSGMKHCISNHIDRKSTRLNSSHVRISYAVFCLKKKNNKKNNYYD